MPNAADIDCAVKCFVKGFAFTRSFTYPYRAEKVGRLWVVRDADRPKAKGYRREEWVANGICPAELNLTARKKTRGSYAICAISPAHLSDATLRSEYKSLGYRLGTTEALMMHRLTQIRRCRSMYPIERVLTQERADRVAQEAGRAQIPAMHLKNQAELRLYAAFDGKRSIGWLRSIAVESCTWVSNVYVKPNYRRQGVGKALLATMLKDDRKFGSQASCLLASHTGQLLYQNMGYELLGTLLLFTPKKIDTA